MPPATAPTAEWLETDGLGGFASGCADGIRRRRYHALLLAATTPPTGRVVLVNGVEVWVEMPAGAVALSSQRYGPDVRHPDGADRIVSFEAEPWPRWRFRLPDGTEIEHEVLVQAGAPVAALSWRVVARPTATPRSQPGTLHLAVRPLLSGRDYHSLHHENPAFRFEPERRAEGLCWRPYDGLPAIRVTTNGVYAHEPVWYRNFLYEEERARGLDCVEDLAAPGTFRWDLADGPGVLMLAAELEPPPAPTAMPPAIAQLDALRGAEERRRRGFPSRLHRAADAYVVRRGAGKTIVAGYPWFTDWGRDTFIALRGLCLASGRLDDARDILLAWADAVSEGMLPNRFPDRGDAPEFNAVDASLWFVIAAHELLEMSAARGRPVAARERRRLTDAIAAVLAGYARGTRYGIRLDDDGLLAAGEAGAQLTWMDAKVGDWVVTPRVGKPVEVEALWLNALHIGSALSDEWQRVFTRASVSFRARFWNEALGHLHDVVDPGHVAGTADATFRPNQIFAVGGLPLVLLDMAQARRVVAAVEARLLTPLGLRSLAADEPGYVPHYEGGPRERDAAYHQGTVWPWLMGPFVEAWVRVRGDTVAARREARLRFLAPLLGHRDGAGLGHLPEIACGDPPHTPRGCPFQAWSVGEALRLSETVLAADTIDRVRA